MGMLRLQNDLKKSFKDMLKEKQPERVITGKFKIPCESISPSAKLRGFVVDTWQSDYLELHLTSFQLHNTSALAGQKLYVFDLETGLLIEAVDFDILSAGLNVFTVGKDYSSGDSLYIAYDATNITSCETESRKEHTGGCYHNCGCSTGCHEIDIAGDPATMVIDRDALNATSNCGLILNYTLKCSFERWLCAHKEDLSQMLLYAMGIQFLSEIDGLLQKANKLTLWPEESRNRLSDDYKDQYQTLLDDFANSMEGDGFCIECDQMFTIHQIHP